MQSGRLLRLLSVLLLALGCTTVAEAQSHPCDAPPVSNPTLAKKTIVVGFCHDLRDAENDPVEVSAFRVYVDGALAVTLAAPTPLQPTPSASGSYYFETAPFAVTVGAHSVEVSAVVDSRGESPRSGVFPFSSSGAAIRVPRDPRVR